jgi:hypothetical protein
MIQSSWTVESKIALAALAYATLAFSDPADLFLSASGNFRSRAIACL